VGYFTIWLDNGKKSIPGTPRREEIYFGTMLHEFVLVIKTVQTIRTESKGFREQRDKVAREGLDLLEVRLNCLFESRNVIFSWPLMTNIRD
jgi:hypothetical protein